ncbi:Cytochrome oxidase biogenesis protein Sco1/SenC/PrrC, putative copper metallochaperone [plant metagenome]|uniref:Cytochrome oxidase biogenesis protein Sco1/SenC/PrrC, putative copper metallochaperone n=1 Tax=plant metagenome TaxID=1297885 RepID=A0A484RL94_9ZZZZ
MKRLSRLSRLLIAAVAAATLSACNPNSEEWSLYDVKGHVPNLSFTLSAAGGKTLTEKDLKGKTVLMFFGYASCPDVCPTTMAQLNEVMQRLGPEAAEKVRILFISVDPHRDTPDVLQAYVDAFSPNAVGLTGTPRQVADLARRYRVAFEIEKPRPGDDADVYEVSHSRGIYVFDNRGRARLLASDSESVEALTHDLRQLLAQTS